MNRRGSARAALIIAHPGHELLLHRWLELERSTVFALTDAPAVVVRIGKTFARRFSPEPI